MTPRRSRYPSKAPKDPGKVIFRLDQLLEQLDIRQIRVSEASGLDKTTVSRIARQSLKQLDFETLARLCYALNITDMNQLFQYFPPAGYEPPLIPHGDTDQFLNTDLTPGTDAGESGL